MESRNDTIVTSESKAHEIDCKPPTFYAKEPSSLTSDGMPFHVYSDIVDDLLQSMQLAKE